MPEPTEAKLLAIASEAVGRGAEMIRGSHPGRISMKSDRNPVTSTDLAVEREIREFLASAAPQVGFLGEEGGRHGEADSALMWALDPVDGTVNYLHGIPLCAVSLGLVKDGQAVLGCIATPFLSRTYEAIRGRGAFADTGVLRASAVSTLSEAVVSVGDYAVGAGSEEKNQDRLQVTVGLVEKAQRVRMFGSAAIDLAWVAEGRIGASVMLNNKPWDTAAGVIIASESGAVVTDRNGSPFSFQSASTVACAPSLKDALIAITLDERTGSEV